MKILIITNLFPNSKETTRGMYNKQQFMELAKLCELEVVAPIPWHHFSRTPVKETIDEIEVYHPRYFMLPKIGRSLYGFFFFISLVGFVKKIYKYFKFDLIVATWAYPDGFGSFLITKVLKKPIVIKTHGSDINIRTKYFLRRKMISYALRNSNKVITVSNALKGKIVEIGVPEDKIAVIPNGVDTDLFKPMNQQGCREILGLPLTTKIVLFIGNLVHIKGVDYLMDAFSQVSVKYDSAILIIVGDGNLKGHFIKKAKCLGLEGKIKFISRQPHNKIPLWMNACDVFCLPSLNEGCPNVILETLACGKPVVATKVGGIPEIISSEDYGILVTPGNSIELAQGLQKALEKEWNPEKLHQYVSGRDWKANAEEIFRILNLVITRNTEKLESDVNKNKRSKEIS